MKKVILVLTFTFMMLLTACNQTLQITIVLPPFLEPYYEWLINIPELQTPETDEPAPTEIWKSNNASIIIIQDAPKFDDILHKLIYL